MQKMLECNPQRLFAAKDYAVVVLNTPIELNDAFFLKIWNNAIIKHVVDGGTNRFFQLLDRQPDDVKINVKYPDIASGDFDSITDESMARLKDAKRSQCKIILTEDQNETDFTKALRVLQEQAKTSESLTDLKSVIVVSEFSGRLDQILGNLNTLHKNVFVEDSTSSKPSVYIIGSENLCWLLPANCSSTISFEKQVPNFTCGVVPFQGPTKYTSTGLKWDLTPDMVCVFGGIISTNNIVIAQNLKIFPEENHSIFTLELTTDDYVF